MPLSSTIIVDHGGLLGLADDDHTQYALPADLGRGGNASVAGDNDKLLFGAAQDAAVYYDGTDLVIDTQEVGSGNLKVLNGQLVLISGSAPSPGIVFAGETDLNTGFFRSGQGNIAFSSDGVQITSLDGSGIRIKQSPWNIRDIGGDELLIFEEVAGAVNEITVKNAATGAAPEFSATGSDTNIDLALTPKGTGNVLLNGALALLEKSADPVQPAEGYGVIWLSDGTGKGDDGDVLIASQAGGVTRWATLFDHSAGTLW